jgi:hypothetical protein
VIEIGVKEFGPCQDESALSEEKRVVVVHLHSTEVRVLFLAFEKDVGETAKYRSYQVEPHHAIELRFVDVVIVSLNQVMNKEIEIVRRQIDTIAREYMVPEVFFGLGNRKSKQAPKYPQH